MLDEPGDLSRPDLMNKRIADHGDHHPTVACGIVSLPLVLPSFDVNRLENINQPGGRKFEGVSMPLRMLQAFGGLPAPGFRILPTRAECFIDPVAICDDHGPFSAFAKPERDSGDHARLGALRSH